MDKSQREALIELAIASSRNAYAPYSNFNVGAAVLCADGEVFPGCNVENSSFGLTICAERVAVSSAIATNRAEFVAIAIASKNAASPCGACRQFLNEFNRELAILLVDLEDGKLKKETVLSELLPDSFHLGD